MPGLAGIVSLGLNGTRETLLSPALATRVCGASLTGFHLPSALALPSSQGIWPASRLVSSHLACITSRLGLWLVAFRARLGLNDSMLKVAKGLLLARWLQARWLHRILADAKGKGFSFAATSKDILWLDCLFFAFGWAGFHFPFGWAAWLGWLSLPPAALRRR